MLWVMAVQDLPPNVQLVNKVVRRGSFSDVVVPNGVAPRSCCTKITNPHMLLALPIVDSTAGSGTEPVVQ